MGGGTSIPKKIDKEAFKVIIVQGALSDQIFDENSTDGVMVTNRFNILQKILELYIWI